MTEYPKTVTESDRQIHHLLVVEDSQGKHTIALEAGTCSIGRDSANSIVLNSNLVSRQHAILLRVTTPDNAAYLFRIIDGNLQGKRSRNGLVINGKRCFSHDLRHGDVVVFGGDVRARYYASSSLAEVELLTSCEAEDLSGFLSNLSNPFGAVVSSSNKLENAGEAALVRLASFPELLTNPILEIDLAGIITYLNPAAATQFPNIRAAGLQHPILAGLLSTELLAEIAIAQHQKKFFVREVELNNRVFEQSVHYIAESELVRSYIADVTERKQAEDALQKAHAQLEIRVEARTAELSRANEQLQSQVAVAQRLVEERRQAEEEVRLLQTITQAISESPDFHACLEVVLRQICEVTGWSYGEAWIPDSNGLTLTCSTAWYGTSSHEDLPQGRSVNLTSREANLETFRRASEVLTFPPALGLPGRVWLSGQPEWMRDVSNEPDTVFVRAEVAKEIGFKAGLGVPIINHFPPATSPKMLAVLVFFMFTSSEEDKRLTKLVSTIATQLSSLIQRKRVENSLRESQERYRAVVEQTSEGLFLVDVDTKRILEANPAFQKLLGYTLAEMLELTLYDVVALDPETIDRRAEQVLWEKHFFISEVQHHHKNGSLVEAEVNVNLISYGDKQVFCIVAHDIAERKQAEEALQRSFATNRALLNAIPDLIFRISRDGIFVNFKAPKDSNLPVSPEKFMGKNLYEVLPLEVAESFMGCVEGALQTSKVQILEFQLPANDTWQDYEARIVVSAKDEVMAIVRDITERKRAEVDIQNALAKEKELGELKSRFVTMTSHEFRTPMATILSSTELLEHYSHRWSEEKKLGHLQRIQSAIKQMTGLLNDVLLVGKAEAGKLEFKPVPLDFVQFCRDLVEEIQLTTSNHTIAFQAQATDTHACMDEKILRHILTNLLSNAIKYSPQSSTVHFDIVCNWDTATFQVQDEGIGIPVEDQAQLFNSFHRASNVGNISGTGLGLAIVKKSVDLHGGSIAVQSKLGAGTTFTVTLPLYKQV